MLSNIGAFRMSNWCRLFGWKMEYLILCGFRRFSNVLSKCSRHKCMTHYCSSSKILQFGKHVRRIQIMQSKIIKSNPNVMLLIWNRCMLYNMVSKTSDFKPQTNQTEQTRISIHLLEIPMKYILWILFGQKVCFFVIRVVQSKTYAISLHTIYFPAF